MMAEAQNLEKQSHVRAACATAAEAADSMNLQDDRLTTAFGSVLYDAMTGGSRGGTSIAVVSVVVVGGARSFVAVRGGVMALGARADDPMIMV